MDKLTFTLHHHLTEEEMDTITDADLEHTPTITFHTKHGKEVTYKKHNTGKWIDITNEESIDYEYKCSECGNVLFLWSDLTNYCPNCGADMRVKNDHKSKRTV